MKKLLLAVICGATLALVACGGSGAGVGGAPSTPTSAPSAPTSGPSDPTSAPSDPTSAPSDPTSAPSTPTSPPPTEVFSVRLEASPERLLSDGSVPVELTAVVTTADGVAVAGQTVTFAARDSLNAVRIQVTSATTDMSGFASASLHINGDATERDVSIFASVGQQAPVGVVVPVRALATSNFKVWVGASPTLLLSDGTAPVELTAVVSSQEGVAFAGQQVVFSVNDAANGVRIEVTRAETDANGIALATLHLNGNNSERDVTVLASVGQQAPVGVVVRVAAKAATSLRVRLGRTPSQLLSDGSVPVELRAVVTNQEGVTVGGKRVDFGVRDPAEGVSVEVTGSDTTADGVALAILKMNGSSTERDVTVFASVDQQAPVEMSVRVVANIPPTSVILDPLNVRLIPDVQNLLSDGSAPVMLQAIVTNKYGVTVAGKKVDFAVIDAFNGVRIEVTREDTDASGVATAGLFLNGNNTTRDVTVLASVDQQVPIPLVVAIAVRIPETPTLPDPLRVRLSPTPQQLVSDGSLPVTLTAVVTNADGVVVPGKQVAFTVRDPLDGVRIEIVRAQTDSSGIALANLLMNGESTERDIIVRASVDQQPAAELVVHVGPRATGGSADDLELTVRLGTDNLIEDLEGQLSYRKRYVAIVADRAGIPKVDATVLVTLRSKRYYVGYWFKQGTSWGQVQLIPDGVSTEDLSNFGNCDAGEDLNGDRVLTPGNIASYTVQSRTDASGVAVLNIVYPKSFAQWAQMELEVSASVGGTEGFSAMTIPLPIPPSIVNAENAPPSIARTRGSLRNGADALPPGSGDEAPLSVPTDEELANDPSLQPTYLPSNAIVAGSPFPYLSVTPTCP